MQVKTIQKVIVKKMNEWLETISDKNLRQRVKDNLLVSGGSIASMLLGEKVNDFDVYLQDRKVLADLVKYYISGFDNIRMFDGHNKEELKKSNDYAKGDRYTNYYTTAVNTLKEQQLKLYFENKAGGFRTHNADIAKEYVNDEDRIDSDVKEAFEEIIEDTLQEMGSSLIPDAEKPAENQKQKKYLPAYFSPNAISLTDDIQIVLRFWGTPAQIHETFDFVHATNFFTFATGIVTNIQALEALLARTLRYQGSHYPLTSIIRAKKFMKRGWRISAGEYLKIMMQISKLDLSDPDILEEQLIGVDVAYFEILITALRNKMDRDSLEKLDDSYIFEMIDRIFNGEGEVEDDFNF